MSKSCATIDRFEVTEELGRGSMGVVRRAHDPETDREVAIRIVEAPAELSPDERGGFAKRFERDALAAGQLSHPGIVAVHDVASGPGDNDCFIVMEYVDGSTLETLIHAEGSLKADWILSVGENLAHALQHAHDAGVIHRDLRASSILVRTSDGMAKIGDFGVPQIAVSEMDEAGKTPAYTAPERLRGERADVRSDLFSLGVIFYEAFSGTRPFRGVDFASTCSSIMQDRPESICKHEPELAPNFETFFARALAKDPAKRFQSGREMAAELRELRLWQRRFERGGSADSIAVAVEHEPAPATALPAEALVLVEETPNLGRREIGIAAVTAASIVIVIGSILMLRSDPDSGRVSGPAAVPVEEVVSTLAVDSFLDHDLALLAPVGPQPPPKALPVAATAQPEPQLPPKPEAVQLAEPKPKPKPKPIAKRTPKPAPAAKPVAAALPVVEFAALPKAKAGTVVAAATADAYMDVRVRSMIKQGTLILFLDGLRVYEAELQGEGKLMGRLKKRATREGQLIETRLDVASGARKITARVVTPHRSRELVQEIPFEIEPGQTRELQIVAGGGLGRRLTMNLD